jgi:major vault protein
MMNNDSLFRIPPFFYLHVLDCNTNVTRLEIGPKTYIRQDNERVVYGPERMITVPPRHYCIIENPVIRSKEGEVISDEHGSAKLAHADQEIRLAREPFPLYPGETLKQPVTPLKVVLANHALRLRAVLDIEMRLGRRGLLETSGSLKDQEHIFHARRLPWKRRLLPQ